MSMLALAVSQLGEILFHVVSPLLILAAVGFVLQRRLGLDMRTLTRLNFYLIIPGLIYVSIVESKLTAGQVGTILGFTALCMAILAGVAWTLGTVRRIPDGARAPLVMTAIFYNSANYGIPLQELAFRHSGGAAGSVAIQIFVVLLQNMSTFTLGILLATHGRPGHRLRDNVREIARFPSLYALIAGLTTITLRSTLGVHAEQVLPYVGPIWDALLYVKSAFIAIALCTLGAQLAVVERGGPRYPLALTVSLRLIGGPLVGLGLIHLLGLHGVLAQVLFISTATPTAVNAMLLCAEFDNHPSFVAKSVFYSMILSPLTVTVVIFLAQSGVLPALR